MDTTTRKTIDFIKSFKAKKIRVSCNQISYITSNLDLFDDKSVYFNDIYNHRVMLSISQITRIEEVN